MGVRRNVRNADYQIIGAIVQPDWPCSSAVVTDEDAPARVGKANRGCAVAAVNFPDVAEKVIVVRERQ